MKTRHISECAGNRRSLPHRPVSGSWWWQFQSSWVSWHHWRWKTCEHQQCRPPLSFAVMELERCLNSHWSTDSGSFGLSEEVWWCWAQLALDQLVLVWEFPVGAVENCRFEDLGEDASLYFYGNALLWFRGWRCEWLKRITEAGKNRICKQCEDKHKAIPCWCGILCVVCGFLHALHDEPFYVLLWLDP